ncbi:PadR family transcriptional regulator [Haloferax sp. Atlit-12N]|uniref:PadR family transcriptional regulator n=1 Tax=Haloferax sp. Atlit-12N TaxID=2077203 RepID=UPI000E2678FB|nr:PadR family transcriptional regulator [Haloferax sp. Atlit-12N]RDZ61406.1 PadR family transcriptional regulator [Haloferax sp. Atlit-12N]
MSTKDDSPDKSTGTNRSTARRNTTAAADLTAFQNNILVILAEEPMYGLAIKRELETYYGEDVNHGRLYPNLDDLVERGFVKKSELDKRTNQYELTDDGLQVVFGHLDWAFSKLVTDDERAETVTDLIDSNTGRALATDGGEC